jgi:hypothetical protein
VVVVGMFAELGGIGRLEAEVLVEQGVDGR